jgi:steroid 5-alpha reductase family enzyme
VMVIAAVALIVVILVLWLIDAATGNWRRK